MANKPVAFNLAGGQQGELPEISLFDQIDDLARCYERERGVAPIRLSHWDPSEEFLERVGPLRLPTIAGDLRPYRYSYLIKRKIGLARLLAKLGFHSDEMRGHLVENSTNAITLIANWLKARGVREVVLVTPTYFTARYNLMQLGLTLHEVQMKAANGEYCLPDDLPQGPRRAIWLTNPIYSTGVYLSAADIGRLKSIADAGTLVIADEALSLLTQTLARDFDGNSNFVGIYSPHKAICVNGLKFSLVVFHESAGDSFDHWADVVCGGLSVAAEAAVEHFLGTAFEDYGERFAHLVERVRGWHHKTIAKFGNSIGTDSNSRGHFLSIYVPNLPSRLGIDLPFHTAILSKTGCSVIPGQMHGFDPSLGFSFRLNLARHSKAFERGVEKLYGFLTRHALG